MKTNLEILTEIKDRKDFYQYQLEYFTKRYLKDGEHDNFDQVRIYLARIAEMEELIKFIEKGPTEE